MTSATRLGPLQHAVEETLVRLDEERVVERIWQKDPTVWRDDPSEIVDRLGWLDLVAEPPAGDPELAMLVAEVATEGVRDVVLLGMGGSSLGAEALRAILPARAGAPRLYVLDSTHPSWVRRVRRAIDPDHALFVVASKSGTTAEVDAFHRYFWGETEAALGRRTGSRFVAVTDPGTPLALEAERKGFRRCLVNPPDIGGRFSVLSRFGLVPAALGGIDVETLVARAHATARGCRPPVKAERNTGAWLGTVLGVAARSGRPLLTLLTPPRLAEFGLWVEQLVAESTGKDGKGIVPVTGEPDAPPEAYGPDRLFVGLRLEGDDDRVAARLGALAQAGHPTVDLVLTDLGAFGGELFRWQLATAVAGHLIGVQPFDQPDVESAKRETKKALAAWRETGTLPTPAADAGLGAALAAGASYVALLAFTDASPALEAEVAALRRDLLGRGLASTFGYGPRFLHSTGQLHKGGPGGGLFVQLVAERGADLAIPGAPGFGTLIAAQAAGDLAALHGAGRRTVRLDLGDDAAAGLRRVRESLAR